MKPTKSYLQFIQELKKSISQSRYQAARLANKEQLVLYIRVGEMLNEKIKTEKWGNNVLEQVAADLQNQVPGLRGFSYRNLRNMRQFYLAYESSVIWQSLTAKLINIEDQATGIAPLVTAESDYFFGISFTHHISILNKCANIKERFFYIMRASVELWSVTVLEHNIDSRLFEKRGKLPNNFIKSLAEELKPKAVEIFHDEYLMDYMNLSETDNERDVENKIVTNIRDFILRMGKGFSFIGNQYRVELVGDEFFIDLLFFNRHLRCLVAFELKKGKFKPEYAGQLNFYLNVLDDKIKLPEENNSIGIILCKEKNNTVVEFSVRSIENGMGVATFKTSKEIPNQVKEVLPDTNELKKLL